MSFQAEVGAYLATLMLARTPVGQRYDLNHAEQIIALRLESGQGVDDIVATLSGGGFIKFQCKTSLSLSSGEKSDLSKTIAQCVEELVAAPTLDPDKHALVIALPVGASSSIDTLVAATARVAAGDVADLASASIAEQSAFEKLKACADRAWSLQAPGAASDIKRLAKLLRVVRFDRGATGAMRIDGSALLGRSLYGGDAKGGAPFTDLLDIIRDNIKTGHAINRAELLASLRKREHRDVAAPGFDGDIAKINARSLAERQRLGRYAALPLNNYRLSRACQPALLSAARLGSLLLIGEPGAGKTGALDILAEDWTDGPIVVLSVDQFAGIVRTRDLSDDLRIEHEFIEVLAAWPGSDPGLLIIDALDAARGGQAEAIFVTMIERMAALAPRWRVVASVRTFDLLNGQRLRGLMPGIPPSPDHADSRAGAMRHFLIPILSSAEREQIAADVPPLATLLRTDNARLSALLGNIFNLSLAANLVESGVAADSFDAIATQSDLIDRYEDIRLIGLPARSAMIAAVGAMVALGNLSLRAAELDHAGLEAVLASGILEERDDRYAFTHHILFDHAAGRFYIDTASGAALTAQLQALGSKAFMLAPALRFALERFWRRDMSAERRNSWTLLFALAQQRELGPIAAAAALRTAAEQVASESDTRGLDEIINKGDPQALNRTLFQIARFVAMRIDAEALSTSAAIAWCGVAERIATRGGQYFVEPARFLLHPFSEKHDLSDPVMLAAFGRAARAGLANACAQDATYRNARSMGVDFVARAYGSDPEASRAVLAPMLTAAWLEQKGHEDAPALAKGLRFIVPLDPDFVGSVFRAILNQPIPSDDKTDMGGSRILALSSTRAQDFKHSFFYLRKAFRQMLALRPDQTVALLTISALAKSRKDGGNAPSSLFVTGPQGASVEIVADGLDLWDWRQPKQYGDASDIEMPVAFATCVASADQATLAVIVEAALAQPAAASVWRRLFGGQLTPARRGLVDQLLWPVAANPTLIESRDLGRDTIDYLRAVYATIGHDDRRAFEEAVAAHIPSDKRQWKRMHDRLLTALLPSDIVTSKLKRRRSTLARNDGLRGNGADYSHGGRILRAGRRDEQSKSAVDRAVRRIEKAGAKFREAPDSDRLSTLWKAIASAHRLAGKATVEGDEKAKLWSGIGEGLVGLIGSNLLVPDTAGLPSLGALQALLGELVASEMPGPDEGSLGWSTDAVRVYAAKAVMRAATRWLAEIPELTEYIETLLTDPNASVRNTLCERLSWLRDADAPLMWRLIDEVVANETHSGVLAFLVVHPLSALSELDPERIEALLAILDARGDALPDSGSGSLTEMIAQLATEMAVDDARGPALAMIEGWTTVHPIKADRLSDVLQRLRGRFFYRYLPADDARVLAGDRALHVGQTAARAAAAQLAAAKARLWEIELDDPDRHTVIDAYIGADRTLDQLVTQLYFGSGAYKESAPTDITLNLTEQKMAFFADWSATLLDVEAVATPHTIKYLLEIYEHLLDADPPSFFARIAVFLTGPAAAEFYESEQLAAGDLVTFVRHMLADHRALFDDPEQRDHLVAMLDLFADAGWPEAMRLLWELPDLLR